MLSKGIVALAEIVIDAQLYKVWDALVNPVVIKKYMFGTTVETDWTEGSSIVWKGEWKGKEYEDKGKVLQVKPQTKLQYTHFSPLAGKEDQPENYHTVTIDLSDMGERTMVSLRQDNNGSEDEKEHAEKNWQTMLEGMKKVLEDNG